MQFIVGKKHQRKRGEKRQQMQQKEAKIPKVKTEKSKTYKSQNTHSGVEKYCEHKCYFDLPCKDPFLPCTLGISKKPFFLLLLSVSLRDPSLSLILSFADGIRNVPGHYFCRITSVSVLQYVVDSFIANILLKMCFSALSPSMKGHLGHSACLLKVS